MKTAPNRSAPALRTDSSSNTSNVMIRRAIGWHPSRICRQTKGYRSGSTGGYRAILRKCGPVVKMEGCAFRGRTRRPGLQDAPPSLERGGDILVVLKFDRFSRSIAASG